VNRERSRSVVAAPLLQNVPATRKNFFRGENEKKSLSNNNKKSRRNLKKNKNLK
jgi:hypothetical protein